MHGIVILNNEPTEIMHNKHSATLYSLAHGMRGLQAAHKLIFCQITIYKSEHVAWKTKPNLAAKASYKND